MARKCIISLFFLWAGMEWALKVVHPELRTEALMHTVGTWFDSDQITFSGWLENLAPSSAKDAAIVAMIDWCSCPEEKTFALHWVDAIESEGLKEKALDMIRKPPARLILFHSTFDDFDSAFE